MRLLTISVWTRSSLLDAAMDLPNGVIRQCTKWTAWLAVASAYLLAVHTVGCKKTVELKSNSVTWLSRDGPVGWPATSVRHHRGRRSVFPDDMKAQLVAKHNDLRRQEGASDMEYMIWNDYLASMAEDWAKMCRWEHGQPSRPADELPFDPLGQNLYVSNGPFDPLHGIQLFYDEKAYYDYDTGACSKPPCGHYTQVVWSTSREVGCAYAYCASMVNIDLINANYLVCNYGPAGNYADKKPFTKGARCTQCVSGQFWCDDGLCRRDCTVQSTKCQCEAACQNCGTVLRTNCSCSCAAGWTGVDCSEVCEDTHENCGANPGWPTSWCNVDYVREYCPAMCGLCTPSTGTQDDSSTTTTSTTTSTTTTSPTTSTTTTSTTTSTTTTSTTTSTTTTDIDFSDTGRSSQLQVAIHLILSAYSLYLLC